jgi:predicted ATPase
MDLRVKVRNIRSIQETTLHLKRGLNILIGPNGSGKTSTLFALKFLRDLVMHGAAQAVARGGGNKRVYHRGEEFIEFEIICDYGLRTHRRKKVPLLFRWYIRVSQGGPDKISIILKESFRIFELKSNKTFFRIEIDRSKVSRKPYSYFLVSPDEFGRDLFRILDIGFKTENKNKIFQKFIIALNDFLEAVSQDSEQSFFPSLSSLDREISKLFNLIKGIDEYNIIPDLARGSVEQLPSAYMKPNGEGVAEVIYCLKKGYFSRIERASSTNYDRRSNHISLRASSFFFSPVYYRDRRQYDLKEAFENIKRELFAGVNVIDDISTEIDPTNGKRYVVFRSGEQTFSPEEVSDGTIKWLCILVSIYVPVSMIYLLEEPENFLHPWMQQKLISNMREQAQEKEIIYLLTSHSATILNAVEPQELMVVTSSYEEGTTVDGLSDRDEIENLLESSNFRLGDLWVSGVIAGVPGHE